MEGARLSRGTEPRPLSDKIKARQARNQPRENPTIDKGRFVTNRIAYGNMVYLYLLTKKYTLSLEFTQHQKSRNRADTEFPPYSVIS